MVLLLNVWGCIIGWGFLHWTVNINWNTVVLNYECNYGLNVPAHLISHETTGGSIVTNKFIIYKYPQSMHTKIKTKIHFTANTILFGNLFHWQDICIFYF